MDAAERGGVRLDQLYAEAKQLVSYSTNQLRAIATRYREAYADILATLRLQREELEALARVPTGPDSGNQARRTSLQQALEATAAELGDRQMEQAKLELVITHLERAWLFLQRGDGSLVEDGSRSETPTDVQMRILEAQESERQRLAQEVHDGPAQALTNAIFQVEFIDRMLERDPVGARAEIRYLRDLLRRELGDVRAFITQLRPPLLDEIGLYGAIRDQAAAFETATGVNVDLQLVAPPEQLGDTQQTVVLRIAQEALQNVRRHASARHVRVATHVRGGPGQADAGGRGPTGPEGRSGGIGAPTAGADWMLEVEDDGRGFDPDVARDAASRSFGLRFMRERAELIGARLDIDSRPSAGTRVRVTIPAGTDRR
ncbi:MAG: sensor histidine kinase [Candidatus Limnocylindrales bacterium]